MYNLVLRPPVPRIRCQAAKTQLAPPHQGIKDLLDERIPPFQRQLFVMGLGYTGVATARYLQHLDWHVAGTCRRPEDVEILRSQGIEAYEYDSELHDSFSYVDRCATSPVIHPSLNHPSIPMHHPIPPPHSRACFQALEACPYLLITVPPTADGTDPVLASHADLLSGDLSTQLRWLGYLSSTSVYGDHGGRVVDERSPCTPEEGSKGWARLRAEQQWQALHTRHHMPVHTFRLGGIYGPARSALDAVVAAQGMQSGTQRKRARQRYTARVHVGDICRVLGYSMAHPAAGQVYNVVDDDPANRSTVMRFARELLGGEEDALGIRATLQHAAQQEAAQQEGGDDKTSGAVMTTSKLPEKRVSNAKIKADLGVELWYPTYREGLTAIHADDPDPFFYVGEEEVARPSWAVDDASFSIDSFSSSPSFF